MYGTGVRAKHVFEVVVYSTIETLPPLFFLSTEYVRCIVKTGWNAYEMGAEEVDYENDDKTCDGIFYGLYPLISVQTPYFK